MLNWLRDHDFTVPEAMALVEGGADWCTALKTRDVVGEIPDLFKADGEVLRPRGQEQRHLRWREPQGRTAYEPVRCVPRPRYKYIRRFDRREHLVLPNVDDTPSKEFLLAHGWAELPREQSILYDLLFDPEETDNLAGEAAFRPIRDELAGRLAAWMADTGDPLLEGPVPAPSGSYLNDPDGRSPEDPLQRVP